MAQNNIFLVKAVQDILSCTQRKQVQVNEICEVIKKQIKEANYGDDLMKGKEQLISPLIEVIEESHKAKNYLMCCKVIDLIEKLLLYQSIKHVEITYKGQSVDVLVTLINVLSSLFRYNSLQTNLYVAKCMTTIVDKFSITLSTPFIIAIFKTIYDMYIITQPSDTNNGAYKMCIGRIVDIVVSKMNQKSEVNGEYLKGNIQQGTALLFCMSQYATENWTERTLNLGMYNNYVQTITNEAKAYVNMKSKRMVLPLIKSYLDNFPPELVVQDIITPKFVGDLTEPIIVNSLDSTESVLKMSIEILDISIAKYRKYMRNNLGLLFSKVVTVLLEGNSVQRQLIVLEFVKKLVKSGTTIIELFVNYDCEVSSPNVFEDIVRCVVKLLQTPELSALCMEVLSRLYMLMTTATEHWESDLHKLLKEEDPVVPESTINIIQLKQQKKIVTDGLAEFEKSPKKGIAFFIEKEMCTNTASSIVTFLHQLSGLDRKAFGDYLGGIDPLNQECLKELLKKLDFSKLSIDESMRIMFAAFVMGGESQVVGRVLTAFSERYSECNPGVFDNISVDEIYQIAMSIICLSTETHNPNAKVKAFDTYDKFRDVILSDRGFNIKMNEDPLKGIFERVVATPFTIAQKDDEPQKSTIIREQGVYNYEASHEVVREMHVFIYKNVCYEVMRFCFVTRDEKMMNRGVTLLQSALHLSAIFFLVDSLDYIIQLMRSLACIDQPQYIEERHLLVIRSLLSVAQNDGEFLSTGWIPFLRCLFEIERLRQIASGWGEQAIEISYEKTDTIYPIEYKFEEKKVKELKEGERPILPSGVITQIDASEINDIFCASGNLGHRGAKNFFSALCQIVLEQIDQRTPGLFAFQILVVVATSNKERDEVHWAPFWDSLSSLFRKCCMHPNELVAMGAVDCLKQLVSLFSTVKEENCENQKRALEPFVYVLADHQDERVKELVLAGIQMLVNNSNWISNMKSGWRILFECVRISAEEEKIRMCGFELLKKFYNEHIEEVNKEFTVFVNSLISFQKNGNASGEEYNREIVRMSGEILKGADEYIEGSEMESIENIQDVAETHMTPMYLQNLPKNAEVYLIKYLPLFTSLAASATGKYESVAEYAIKVITQELLQLSPELTEIVFYRSLYRCCVPEFPHENQRVLGCVYSACLQLPIKLTLPVVSFAFNVLLNHEKAWEETANFLKEFIVHKDFNEVANLYLDQEALYFKRVVEAIKGISSSTVGKNQRVKPNNVIPCEKCGAKNVVYFMYRCAGCFQHYYCEKCCVNAHTLECIRHWKKWRIIQNGLSTIASKGLIQYISAVEDLPITERMLKQLESLQDNLFDTMEKLPLESIAENYEIVVKAIVTKHVDGLEILHDISLDYLKKVFTKRIQYYSANSFMRCNSKELLLYVLDQFVKVENKDFLEMVQFAHSSILKLIASDDLDVRMKVIDILSKTAQLVPIKL
ncbi:guanyl-nucleotide exchange factor, putative [Entamoeba invadens IP1]|uniref:Guanyl-nucleotide exchange factor, putative n=1 Tax=Entamoeba invadens IP1 TaxID=370355 RepID=A0A0A1U2B1_ENTIV|nr:guanyl-nucleotide exchange factor, putative [Entamoeba invadens IP1]ELP88197.1 guanyl-nucleotide exchange factor, putative [Entamoeba invadens IP1]|eukprot:XP_004254968.1 guanyl-nucleotide exchange factor, putative [Entamoeba invadens IP1]